MQQQPANSPILRRPTAADAAEIWRLVRESGELDRNSCYAYLLLTTHFCDTCVVAERQDRLVGFVTGYFPPTRPGVLFVWQVAVAAEARRTGLGKRMLRHLVELPVSNQANFLEATVSPSNRASRRLFESFAEDAGAALRETAGFDSGDFTFEQHEDERLLRIGPLQTRRASESAAGRSPTVSAAETGC